MENLAAMRADFSSAWLETCILGSSVKTRRRDVLRRNATFQ